MDDGDLFEDPASQVSHLSDSFTRHAAPATIFKRPAPDLFRRLSALCPDSWGQPRSTLNSALNAVPGE